MESTYPLWSNTELRLFPHAEAGCNAIPAFRHRPYTGRSSCSRDEEALGARFITLGTFPADRFNRQGDRGNVGVGPQHIVLECGKGHSDLFDVAYVAHGAAANILAGNQPDVTPAS